MVSISYSGAEIYSIVIAGKYCQSYTDPDLNGAENVFYFLQPLGTRSAYNTIIEDPGSPYVATFQCIIYFLFTSLVFYRLYLWYTSFLRFLTKTNGKKNSFAVQ